MLRSWSQFGEDERFAEEFKGSIDTGYYVDIGANHPCLHSNTYRLYNMGMRGVCVEPNDDLCSLHKRYRPGDILLNSAIGHENTILKFFEFRCHELSTFSAEDAARREREGALRLRTSLKPVLRLQTILEQSIPAGRTEFVLLSVDTEGWDEVVLRSHDWNRIRPLFVIVEANNEDAASSTSRFMESVDYRADQVFGVNTLFKRL